LIDSDFRVLLVNSAARPFFGTVSNPEGLLLEEVLQGIAAAELIPPFMAMLRAVLATREPVQLDEHKTLLAESDREIYVDCRVERVPLLDDELGLVCFFSDVTDEVRARRALEESNRRLRLAEERLAVAQIAGNVGVWDWTRGNGHTFLSDSMWALYGIEPLPREQIDAAWRAAIVPDDRARVQASLARFLSSAETSYREEFRIARPDGSVRSIEVLARAKRDAAGEPERVSGVHLDVTDRKLAEAERYAALEEARRTLETSDRRKNEFLATLSHELRNPLAPLRNGIELLRHSPGDGEFRSRVLDLIDRQTTQMVRLVDDLMEVGRITQGKLRLQRSHVSLQRVLDEAVESNRARIEQGRHPFTVRAPDRTVLVDVDRARVVQMLSNLLHNAVKFSERGTPIDLEVEVSGSEVVFGVRDRGIGIAKDKQPLVFELFAQVEDTLDRSQGGLGIGLGLVKRLAEMHGGGVSVESEGAGRGSFFTIRLPVVVDEQTALPEMAAPQCAESKHLKVLVVDDNRDGATTLALLLQNMGCTTRTANDGEDGLRAAKEFRPEVVLLDIGLPKMNGYEVARAIREEPWGKDLFLCAITGFGQESDRRAALSAGFDQHLVKPVDPKLVMNMLSALPS
jgi:PAS domain S-box-containing protein